MTNTMMHEHLTKARHAAEFAADDLRGALSAADPVAALVLLPLIGDAMRLVNQTGALLDACEARS